MTRICPDCNRMHNGGNPRCPCCLPNHTEAANQISYQRRIRDGRNRSDWTNRIRPAVLERDNHTCTCGCGGTTDLVVDRIGGGYHDDNLDAYRTLTRKCSGRIDGARGGAKPKATRPQSPSPNFRSTETPGDARGSFA